MSLLEYLNSLSVDDQVAFAVRCGTTIGYLRQVAYGKRRCGESFAINIDRESGRRVQMETLRPDVDWGHVRALGAGQSEMSHA